jgi:hypothetical protein
MKFGDFGEKIFFSISAYFDPPPPPWQVQKFGQNWSSRAEILAGMLNLYGKSEKTGLIMIYPDSNKGGFCLNCLFKT